MTSRALARRPAAKPSDDELLDEIDDGEEFDPLEEAMMLCSLNPRTGQCGQAGSEYCEFDCPFRDEALP